MNCKLCPRNCNINRDEKKGFCGVGEVMLSRISSHAWEEPCISGTKGSGTIFFAGCNLRCRFCQNYDITVSPHGVEVSIDKLADVFLYVADSGVANINLVTGAQFSDKIALALEKVKSKLRVPVVYNTSSYEKVSALKNLDGLVDVYLPDLKFCSTEVSKDLANAPDYFEVATSAIDEMKRQQPIDKFDADGYITNGVVIRHLVLPSYVEDTKKVLDWIFQNYPDAIVSLMSQYFVARHDDKFPQLNRKLYPREYNSARDYFFNVGLKNGYCQDVSSATADYLPTFDTNDVKKILDKI